MLFIAAMGQKDGGYSSFFRKDFLIKRFCDFPFLIAESVYADPKLFKFHTGRFLRQKHVHRSLPFIIPVIGRTFQVIMVARHQHDLCMCQSGK